MDKLSKLQALLPETHVSESWAEYRPKDANFTDSDDDSGGPDDSDDSDDEAVMRRGKIDQSQSYWDLDLDEAGENGAEGEGGKTNKVCSLSLQRSWLTDRQMT